jgi:hypothetical protein
MLSFASLCSICFNSSHTSYNESHKGTPTMSNRTIHDETIQEVSILLHVSEVEVKGGYAFC